MGFTPNDRWGFAAKADAKQPGQVEPAPAPKTGAGPDAMKTDFANAAEQEQYRRNLDELKARRAKRQKKDEEEVEKAPLGSPTRQDWRPNQLPDGDMIVSAGAKALGFEGDPEELSKFNPFAKIDRIDAFNAGFDALGISRDTYERQAMENASKALSIAGDAVKKDVGAAVMDPLGTASQVPGGMIDAWNEINQFGIDLSAGAARAVGFDPAVVELQKFAQESARLVENPIEEDDTVTGNLIRGISQFAVPFTGGLKAMKAAKFLQKPGAWREVSRFTLSGFMADFTAFDPEADRITDMMSDAGLPIIEYLESDEDDSVWEARFKNGLEGSAIGVASDGLFAMARGLKGMRETKEGLQKRLAAQDIEQQAIQTEIERDLWSNGDPQAPAVEFDAPPKAETTAQRAERLEGQERPDQPIAGQKFLDQDFFEIEPDVEALGDVKPAVRMGDAVENRKRFVENETVSETSDMGDLVGFSARSGDFAVSFERGREGSVVDFDRLDNIINETNFKRDIDTPRTQAQSLRDANEIFSKVAAVIEADAQRTGSPSYSFTAATMKLDSLYQRFAPKMAERMGYDYKATEGGFLLTRPEATEAFAARGRLSIFEAANPEDRAARRQVGGKVPAYLRDQTGFDPETGSKPGNVAAQSLARQLESSRGPRFAFDSAGSPELTAEGAAQRLSDIRQAGTDAFPKEFAVLENDGRIQYARRPSEIEPNWEEFDYTMKAGTTPEGNVVIFTQNTRPDEVAGLMLHEMGIHAGMRNMVGDAGMAGLEKQVNKLLKDGDAATIRARQRVPESTPQDRVLEEVMAYMVQYAPDAALTQAIIGKVKAWVAKTNPKLIKRLNLQEEDYRQLAMLAIRNEAIISGQVVAMFGRLPSVDEYGREGSTAKPMFNLSQPLLLTDELSLSNGQAVRDAMDLNANDANLGRQIEALEDELLGPGFMERLFRSNPDFDPFSYSEAVQAMSRGDVNPAIAEEFRNTVRTIAWNEGRNIETVDASSVVRSMRVAAGPSPVFDVDQLGFMTTAETVMNNPPPRFRDAKELTSDQWRNFFRDGGATGEAFRYHIEPALKEFEGAGKIEKEDLVRALDMHRTRMRIVGEASSQTDRLPKVGFSMLNVTARGASKRLNKMVSRLDAIDQRMTSRREDGRDQSFGQYMDAWRVYALESRIDRHSMRWELEPQMHGATDELEKGRTETDYSDYVSPGRHANYRQELIVLPDAAKGYHSHNWESEGVIGHIRTTDRVDVNGQSFRFVDELQSDLHQEGAAAGYQAEGDKTEALRKSFDAARERYERARDRVQSASLEEIDPDGTLDPNDPPELLREMAAAEEALGQAGEALRTGSWRSSKQPPRAPGENWEKPFIRRVLQRAVADGIDTVAFTDHAALNNFLQNEGTKSFYNERMPAHIRKVAKDLGAEVIRVKANLSDYEVMVDDVTYGIGYRHEEDGSKVFLDSVRYERRGQAEAAMVETPQRESEVLAIRMNDAARAKLRQGNTLFSIGEAPGRMDDALKRTVVDDVKEGRRGLEPDEAEALIGAADRWAQSVARLQPQRGRELVDLVEQVKAGNDPEDLRYLVEVMDRAKAQVKEPPSLLTFLRNAGGIRDEGGELSARDLGRVNFVNNRSGLTMDEALQRAWEGGYIQNKPFEADTLGVGARPADETRPYHNDLFELIDRELMGEKVYSLNDQAWVQEAAARVDARAELDRLGLDPNAPRAQIESEFERIAMRQEGDPLTLRDVEDIDAMERLANAKPGVGLPDRGLIGGNEVRINFNALNTSDDIKSVIGQLADAFSGEIKGAVGETRTNEMILKDSRKISAWEALNGRRTGAPLADVEVPAAQALYLASAENVKKALQHAMEVGTDTAHYNARRALTMHRAIQAEIAGSKADASRALRAWSVTQSATAQARKEMKDVMEQYGGRLDPEEMARLQEMIDSNPEGFDKAVRSMSQKTADSIGEILRFAWLSAPPTHIMNFAGNTLVAYADILPRVVTGLRGQATGNQEMAQQLTVALKEFQGMNMGIAAQLRAFGKSAEYGRIATKMKEAGKLMGEGQTTKGLMRGASALAFEPGAATMRGRFDDRGVNGRAKYMDAGNDRAIAAEAWGLDAESVRGRVLNGAGAVLSAPVEFLGFSDDFFKGIAELSTRHRMAQEMVFEEMRHGLEPKDVNARYAEIVDNPPQGVLDEAKRVAQRRTFTEPVGKGTRGILSLRETLNKVPGAGHVLFPFVVTPSNILKFAFQNGPTGMMFKEVRDELAAGGVRRANAQSRMMLGTGLLAMGASMVAGGNMTGRAPVDPGERELWSRTGRQEYSVKVGDKWYSYRRLEPVSTMMALGADFQTILQNRAVDDDPDDDIEEAFGPMLGMFMNVVASKTYLTGVSDFMQFVNDPERYGPTYLENLQSGVAVPALVASVEKLNDPQLNETSNALEKMMARTPGFSADLPVARDIWGRKRHVSSGLGHWYDALSPFTVRTEEAESIDQELLRIGYYPTRPGKSITVRHIASGMPVNVNISNRPDIYSRYVELAGNELKLTDGMGAKDYLNAVIEGKSARSFDYQMFSDDPLMPASKEKFINTIINQYREQARQQLERTEFRQDLQQMALAAIQAQRQADEMRQQQLQR